MIGNRLDVAIHIGIEVLPALAMINAARYDVEQVRDHARRDEQLSLRVVIDVRITYRIENKRRNWRQALNSLFVQ